MKTLDYQPHFRIRRTNSKENIPIYKDVSIQEIVFHNEIFEPDVSICFPTANLHFDIRIYFINAMTVKIESFVDIKNYKRIPHIYLELNSFSVINITKKDFKSLKQIFIEHILPQLKDFSEELVDQILELTNGGF